MKSNQRTPIVRSKLAHQISFIRGDAPQYGVIKITTIAKDRQAAVEHILSAYGKGTVIIDEDKGEI